MTDPNLKSVEGEMINEIDKLKERIKRLEECFVHHQHLYGLAWTPDIPTSTPKFRWCCLRCGSIKEPNNKNGHQICPECGRFYTRDDIVHSEIFHSSPRMPKEELSTVYDKFGSDKK